MKVPIEVFHLWRACRRETDKGYTAYALNGVRFESAEGRSFAVAGNGFLMVVVSWARPDTELAGEPFILPATECQKILKERPKEEYVRVSRLSDLRVEVKGDTWMYQAPGIEGKYPKWRDVWPTVNRNEDSVADPRWVACIAGIFRRMNGDVDRQRIGKMSFRLENGHFRASWAHPAERLTGGAILMPVTGEVADFDPGVWRPAPLPEQPSNPYTDLPMALA